MREIVPLMTISGKEAHSLDCVNCGWITPFYANRKQAVAYLAGHRETAHPAVTAAEFVHRQLKRDAVVYHDESCALVEHGRGCCDKECDCGAVPGDGVEPPTPRV